MSCDQHWERNFDEVLRVIDSFEAPIVHRSCRAVRDGPIHGLTALRGRILTDRSRIVCRAQNEKRAPNCTWNEIGIVEGDAMPP